MSQEPQADFAGENTTEAPPPSTAEADGQPTLTVTRDGNEYTLIGTAHVSRASADAVLSLTGGNMVPDHSGDLFFKAPHAFGFEFDRGVGHLRHLLPGAAPAR